MHKKLTTLDNTILTMSSSLTDLNKSWTEFSNRLPQLELMYNEVQMMINILPTGMSLTALQHLQKFDFVLWLMCFNSEFYNFVFRWVYILQNNHTYWLGNLDSWHRDRLALWEQRVFTEKAVCLYCESSVSLLSEQCIFIVRAVCLHCESSVSSLWELSSVKCTEAFTV